MLKVASVSKISHIPKVSVVLPIFNVASYLPNALESLKQQSLENIEIICVNNGSTDNSKEIIENYQKDDDRFVLIDHGKKSIGRARNKGIEISKGQYITFLDPDDKFEKNALKELSERADKQENDMILFNYEDVDEQYNSIPNGKKDFSLEVGDIYKVSGDKCFTWKDIAPKIFGINAKFWAAWM